MTLPAATLAAVSLVLAVIGEAHGSAGEAALLRQARAVVTTHLADIERCYRQEHPRLGVGDGRTRIGMRWEVRGTHVQDPRVVEDSLGAPRLAECMRSAISRWPYPRIDGGALHVAVDFTFDGGRASVEGGDVAFPRLRAADGARAFLMRSGNQLVPLACVMGRRSFLGRDCLPSIADLPKVSLGHAHVTDTRIVDVAPGIVRFEHDRVDALGLDIKSLPAAPPKADHENHGIGFATWPPGAFEVHLSPRGRLGRPNPPVWRGPLAAQVTKRLAPFLRHFKGPFQPRLLQTMSIDIDGDGKPETIHNVHFDRLQERPMSPGEQEAIEARGLSIDSPEEGFFLFIERSGRLERLEVRTPASLWDGMDGEVYGWFDVDGDGRPELWLQTPRYEGSTTQVVRFEDGALRTVAAFGFDYEGEAPDAKP